jgi:metal-responsive CopG/Arc/MetJ family transcriptional regulator
MRWYDGGMKTKTSVTLSEDLLKLIDRNAKGEKNRSAFIETAVRSYLEVVRRHRRDQDDLSTINRLAEKLNAEAGDVLSFQVKL